MKGENAPADRVDTADARLIHANTAAIVPPQGEAHLGAADPDHKWGPCEDS
jgi:hypothetical protein